MVSEVLFNPNGSRDPGELVSESHSSPETADNEVGERENGPGVGALLRASRLSCGKDLRDMAQLLRIRGVYIEAIEDGRFQDLPGTTYAVGFVRAYAEHLGLDSEEVVKRFKVESRNINGTSKLHFPRPIAESSFPGGAVVFVGLVVAVLAYGGWYASTTMDGFFTNLVPPIPERLTALLRENGSTRQESETADRMDGSAETRSSPVTATAATPLREGPSSPRTTVEPSAGPLPRSETDKEAARPPSRAPDQVDEMQGSVAAVEGTTATPRLESGEPAASAGISSEGVPTPETDMDGPLDSPVAVATAMDGLPADKSLAATADMAETVPEDSSTADQPAAGAEQPPTIGTAAIGDEEQGAQNDGGGATPSAAADRPIVELENIGEPPKPEQLAAAPASLQEKAGMIRTGRVFGADNAGSRILVRAKSNSWIQVRDDIGNQLMLTRLLRPGDSYRVPDRPGLKLLTGNAGALEILVDGEAVPSIGPVGTVRHGISLDIERLREGTAVQD